jgi:hypothetical protein
LLWKFCYEKPRGSLKFEARVNEKEERKKEIVSHRKEIINE